MKTVVHRADTRGHADHGWLKSFHSFSFGGYYNPDRVHFGALRVLNDDSVSGGNGFGAHPHDNMEIISIPLEGALQHQDSIGNKGVIRTGEIQVMSAGTGIQHSEYNADTDEAVKFLQIWLFPNARNVTPRYDQQTIPTEGRNNSFQQILSPDKGDEGVWIHQDAWFHLADLSEGSEITYTLKNPENGVYIFVLEGELSANREDLKRRDGLGIWEVQQVNFRAITQSSILVMEVPMLQ
ncbi:pirin family protein [Sphingobacterium alkalisoli]|uniref:Pirin family protein n=1 Tax=Sphingobacterium alkalisoli TaxID=1874115 RepID=A0A4U0GU12_9SPHI|nr:pirin family protein [Sphingobacterium alkalisoli]TJY62473.1 pirin family protein [Sphingobacterium alkalisoli]GGH29278.1 hypothetical protein GCM10011418_40430 [Sphingobacterium alkalisoli]